MLISIDHGNSQIKTVHDVFPSGYVTNPAMPQMAENWLEYDGNTYALSGSHVTYRRDKTENDDYYILTLFAIAMELSRAGLQNSDVQLAVGLPPAHLQQLKDAFYKYMVRDKRTVEFRHNGQDYSIRITGAYVFPQAYAAVYDRYEEISGLDKAYIVDIGGYTTDVLLLRKGKLDLDCCYSFESGVIKLFTRAASVITSRFGGTVDESDICGILAGDQTLLNESMRQTVMNTAQTHAEKLLDSLTANDIDLKYSPSYFLGGGALLLRDLLENSGSLKRADFVTDTLANAKGYEAMAKAFERRKQEE